MLFSPLSSWCAENAVPHEPGSEWAPYPISTTTTQTESGVPMGGADQWLSKNNAHLSQEKAVPSKAKNDDDASPYLHPTTKDTHRQITQSTRAAKPSTGLVSSLFQMIRNHNTLLEVEEGVGSDDLNEEADFGDFEPHNPLDTSNLIQAEAQAPTTHNAMREAILREVEVQETSLLQTAKVSTVELEDPVRGMTEADDSVDAPPGG